MEADKKIRQMLTWAIGGLIFVINSFIALQLVQDDGFVSSLSALIAVILLLIPMIRTIISDLRQFLNMIPR